MNNEVQKTPTRPMPESMSLQSQIGWSISLSATTTWLILWGFWIINATHERYRGRTDLDMPDWFAINMELTIKVIPLLAIAALFNFIAIVWFVFWANRIGWALRIGFVLQWLGSMAVVALLGWARTP